MNVLIVKEDKMFDKNISNICDYYEENSVNFDENIKFIHEKKGKMKIDIYLILSNDINFIEEKFKEFKSNNNILILTNNFDPKHVIGCLILTENLFSINKTEEYIIRKIINVYQGSKRREKIKSDVQC